ncbi:NAD-dependent epimerase/dehydratase family protein [Hazenella sp. IB182357]|uniref:NAD-dependent epimerase/dehydratase family protein n=1 Tax=Polycladospora coralii TaxID=2771432 RepID=A0A926RY19_9BACL|nr:NAD-dependent epimerase/dehydratase family protein [Polycladospora coralii]MBD1373081.1 NAD-dependent epimerase/dehydratase family protein [Polycladospora coralii]
MKKVLVLGGTRFFGKRLVQLLVKQNYDVTILTRGQTADEFGDNVRRLVLDRNDLHALEQALKDQFFDIIFDQICYTPEMAAQSIHAFKGRTNRLIFTSSKSVYQPQSYALPETDFDPSGYPILTKQTDLSYAEGKRLAEAVFAQQTDIPVVSVRLPVVLGPDDYTERLSFHIEHIAAGTPFSAPNLDSKMCFIHAQEAADFLLWCGEASFTGPINACASGHIPIGDFFKLIAQTLKKPVHVIDPAESVPASPYAPPTSWYMDKTLASKHGYAFSQLMDWLPDLIRQETNT